MNYALSTERVLFGADQTHSLSLAAHIYYMYVSVSSPLRDRFLPLLFAAD